MAVHVLDVGLRGTRDYVQGSQILARTGELLAAEADAPIALVAAKFTRITDQGVAVALADGDAFDGPEIGTARYDQGGTIRTVRFHEVPGPQAPHLDEVAKVTGGLAVGDDGAVSCAFAIEGTFEAYLVAVIEFVKAAHAARADGVRDIWFTALAGAHLPLAPGYPREGTMRLEPRIERVVEGRLQTLGLLVTDGGAPPAFQIAFSCVMPA
jgi:hypothetical protein